MTFGFQLNTYFNYNLPFDIVEKKKTLPTWISLKLLIWPTSFHSLHASPVNFQDGSALTSIATSLQGKVARYFYMPLFRCTNDSWDTIRKRSQGQFSTTLLASPFKQSYKLRFVSQNCTTNTSIEVTVVFFMNSLNCEQSLILVGPFSLAVSLKCDYKSGRDLIYATYLNRLHPCALLGPYFKLIRLV
jgi:hypothetical protein